MSTRAYAFRSHFNLDEQHAILQERSGLTWRGGDSDYWGDYIVTRLPDEQTRIRVFIDGGRYVIDISHLASLPGAMPLDEAIRVVETHTAAPS